jgi:hypothetical protein
VSVHELLERVALPALGPRDKHDIGISEAQPDMRC